MKTKTSKGKRSKRSGNTSTFDISEQATKRKMRWRRGIRTDRSKSKRSRRSGNT